MTNPPNAPTPEERYDADSDAFVNSSEPGSEKKESQGGKARSQVKQESEQGKSGQ
ncbi:hypothetical protein [Nigerium massiliense]|uniref:hypothetical protein n=1 Tax=Nigerium massiliense TaxID=1522317 RepID=UPI0012FD02A2|nr:hypothetical protein [Nigerium massiliense]